MVCMDLEFTISACLVLLYVITIIENIYNYIPETNHVSGVYSVAAALYLQLLLNVMLFRMLTMFCTLHYYYIIIIIIILIFESVEYIA